jgi:hypothetical protein
MQKSGLLKSGSLARGWHVASLLTTSRQPGVRTWYTSTSAGAKDLKQSKSALLASAMTSMVSSYHVLSPLSGHAAASTDVLLAMLVQALTY